MYACVYVRSGNMKFFFLFCYLSLSVCIYIRFTGNNFIFYVIENEIAFPSRFSLALEWIYEHEEVYNDNRKTDIRMCNQFIGQIGLNHLCLPIIETITMRSCGFFYYIFSSCRRPNFRLNILIQ
jgi:hypothetical protein